MNSVQSDIVIIGAGLCGLSLAYFLRNQNYKVCILEARDRPGGRIFTKYYNNQSSQELGATWFGKKHQQLIQLLEELNLDSFEQLLGDKAIYEPISTSPPQLVSLPPNSDPSYRIKGGSSKLINTLIQKIDSQSIYYSQIVKSIENHGSKTITSTETQIFESSKVISTLPPNLLGKTIKITPTLPNFLKEVLDFTHTWMGESIKIGLNFKTPFWRGNNLSGTIFSNVGPIPEMYDHSDFLDSYYSLKGFLNGAYYSVSKKERMDIVLKQLHKYYGDQVKEFLNYEETVWRNERFTFASYDEHILPHQNNGHQAYQQSYLNGSLMIAGSETANIFPGYMEGAIVSAKAIAKTLLSAS